MAGDIKLKYGESNQAVAITLASLAHAAARNSDVVDNTTNQYVDVLIGGMTKSGPTCATTGYVNVYAYGTVNDSAATVYYTEGSSPTDCAITLTAPTNARLIGVINEVACLVSYKFGPFSVAAAFGGIMPRKWGLIFENKTNGALNSTAAEHDIRYQGVYAQYT